ncbi:hypothetical protein B0H67DRAFT_640434 [Lasiosphaeris hirsuta]|uniref:Heterokaryon incompatibility domain-containing protein n=1 Tax=Lasiosphaeris hirsuta TaxID=260670 RepID=A0AA40BD87_9PEZI|nr:hypothetical protein B0H67DRAFT_640434 [Lasiosphaeris hirsuta]
MAEGKTGKFGKPTLPVRVSFSSSIGLQNRSNLVQDQDHGEIKEFLDRSWFTRVWIIQEAVLACKLVVMCSPEVMSWNRIGTVIHRAWIFSGFEKVFGMVANPHHQFPDETYQALCHLREKRVGGGWGISLYQLLYDYPHLDCTVPQDRMYGFPGLAPAAESFGIEPDYNLRPDEAYRAFARSMIDKSRCLDLLNCVREWRGDRAPFPKRVVVAYSLLDQARYHDVHAVLTDGLEHPTRRGWARLPPGWERIQDEGKPCYYRNHNDEPATDHENSPLESGEPTPAQVFANQRSLPKG